MVLYNFLRSHSKRWPRKCMNLNADKWLATIIHTHLNSLPLHNTSLFLHRGWSPKKNKPNIQTKQTVDGWTIAEEYWTIKGKFRKPTATISWYNFVLYFHKCWVVTVSCYKIKRPQENVTLTFIPFTKSFGLTDNILRSYLWPFLR